MSANYQMHPRDLYPIQVCQVEICLCVIIHCAHGTVDLWLVFTTDFGHFPLVIADRLHHGDGRFRIS